jgi:eukaryotic-like serine/threonine-protein kinase
VSAATSTSNRQPPHIPHHAVTRAIGRGSYGEIWLARSLTGAWRAVKIVDRRRFEDTRSFEREFEGMAKFEPLSREHEGFVDILHVGRSDDDAFFYYVMELADDAVQRPAFDPAMYEPKTLKSELKRVARLPADEVITLGLSLTTALAALHANGLAHRDIKPANIIFCGGQPKIADIGLVSAMGQASFVGTEGYVPPEGPGTVQADIYSLGKVLYEIAMAKDRMEFPAINSALNELPDRALLLRLNDVLLRACAFDPAERYTSAEEMHDDLVRVRDGRPLVGRRSRRRRLPFAALLVAGVSSVAWWSLHTPAGKGSAYIETEPPGVKVRIEDMDRLWAETPAKFDGLPAGEHVAHILSALYETEDVKFTVTADAETRVPKISLRRSVGGASIASVPPGCEFDVLDGAKVVRSGRAPQTFYDLPTGPYELVMRHEGREKHEAFTVGRGEPDPVKIEFVAWKFSVSSVPAGAEIFADGKPAGKAPCDVSLIEGGHQLTARYRTWPEQTRTVKAGPGEPVGVPFVFETGSVKISSAPTGAQVWQGGKKLEDVTPLLIEDLPPGEVRYTLKLDPFEPKEVVVRIEPGKQVFASERFDAKPRPRRGAPWENSLGMKFVPVGDVLVCIWVTRKRDYEVFSENSGRPALAIDFTRDENHPAVRVDWHDANAFCEWLTKHEITAGKLDEGQHYRLPSDAEWSRAAGMPDEGGTTPEQRDNVNRDFPWEGRAWPPPARSGNFADTDYRKAPGAKACIADYTDGWPRTSPVGAFPPNKLGLFDMAGNVWQWIHDSYNGGTQKKDWGVLRGGSWLTSKREELRLGYRNVISRDERDVQFGFRVVLVPER